LILQLNRACVEGNADLSQEAIDVILRADLLIGLFVADSNPDVLEAWPTKLSRPTMQLVQFGFRLNRRL
jgi:hypothetical protein